MGWILLAILPQPVVIVDTVDRLELNHFYDDNGGLVLKQYIGWERDGRCRFWTMDKQLPLRKDVTGMWILLFDDGFILREIRSPSYSESHTQYDPELLDRELLPKEARRPLSRMFKR